MVMVYGDGGGGVSDDDGRFENSMEQDENRTNIGEDTKQRFMSCNLASKTDPIAQIKLSAKTAHGGGDNKKTSMIMLLLDTKGRNKTRRATQ